MINRWFVVCAAISVALLGAPSSAREQASSPAAPGLQGAWQQEGRSAMMIATPTWVAFVGVESMPAAAKYAISRGTMTLQPLEAPKSFEDQILENDLGIKASSASTPIVLERFAQRVDTVSFVAPDGVTLTWTRLE